MSTFLTYIVSKFINIENVSKLIARLIGNLISNASKKGGKTWYQTKKIVSKIRLWLDLFDQVYVDDKMTKEEEEIVAEAIRNEVNLKTVVKILKKNIEESK